MSERRKLVLAWAPVSKSVDFVAGVDFALNYVDSESSPWSKQEDIVERLFETVTENLRGGAKAAAKRRVCLFALCCLSVSNELARKRCWQLLAPNSTEDINALFDFFFKGTDPIDSGLMSKDQQGRRYAQNRQTSATLSVVEKALLLLLVWVALSSDQKRISELAKVEGELAFFSHVMDIAAYNRLLQAQTELLDSESYVRSRKKRIKDLVSHIEAEMDNDFYEKERELFSAREALKTAIMKEKAARMNVEDLAEARDIVWQIPLSWTTDENITIMEKSELRGALDAGNAIEIFLQELDGNEHKKNTSRRIGNGQNLQGRGYDENDASRDDAFEDEDSPGRSMPEWRVASLVLLQSLVSPEKMFSMNQCRFATRIETFQRRELILENIDQRALDLAEDILLHYHCIRISLILRKLDSEGDSDEGDAIEAQTLVQKLCKHFRLASLWKSSYVKLCEEAIKVERNPVAIFAECARGDCTWSDPTNELMGIVCVEAPREGLSNAIATIQKNRRPQKLYFRCGDCATFRRVHLHDAGINSVLRPAAAADGPDLLYAELVSACRRHRRREAREKLAACRLQAIARGNACRLMLRRTREAKALAQARVVAERAAYFVQRAWRRVRLHRSVVALNKALNRRACERKNAVDRIRRWWHCLCTAHRLRVVSIKKRQFAAQKEIARKDRLRRERAAMVMQRYVRRRRYRM